MPFMSFAQIYNPYVATGFISPAPMGQSTQGGSAQFNFTFGNNGTSDLQFVPSQPLILNVSLSRGVPNSGNPAAAVSGTMASYFTWTFDSFSGSLVGTQNSMIPANAVGTIIIDYKPTSDSFVFSPQNGFNVNLIPPAYAVGPNSQTDDNTNSFTYTVAVATPVELSYFSGMQQIGFNQLNWETITEKNTKEFVLYHGKNQMSMEKLVTVPSKAVNNNSDEPLFYNYKHVEPTIGNNFYQLVSIDIDGTENFHNVINLPLVDKSTFWRISPNPAADILNVHYVNGDLDMVHLILTNLLGETVYRKRIVFDGGSFNEVIPMSSLAAGTYILKVTDFEGYNYVEKIIKN